MSKEEKTLSEKFHFGDELLESGDRYYTEEDVKQFIKEILDDIAKRRGYSYDIDNELDELEDFIKQKVGKELVE